MQAQRSPLFHWFLSVGFQSEMIQRFVGQAEYERLGGKTSTKCFSPEVSMVVAICTLCTKLNQTPKGMQFKTPSVFFIKRAGAASILQTQTYIQRLKVFSLSKLCFQGIWTGKCFKWGFLKTKCVWIHGVHGCLATLRCKNFSLKQSLKISEILQ